MNKRFTVQTRTGEHKMKLGQHGRKFLPSIGASQYRYCYCWRSRNTENIVFKHRHYNTSHLSSYEEGSKPLQPSASPLAVTSQTQLVTTLRSHMAKTTVRFHLPISFSRTVFSKPRKAALLSYFLLVEEVQVS